MCSSDLPFDLELVGPVRAHDGAPELRPCAIGLVAKQADAVERQGNLQGVVIVPVRAALAPADPQAAALPEVHPPDGEHAPAGARRGCQRVRCGLMGG